MKKLRLADFERAESPDLVQTSIKITDKQKQFIDLKNLNLSKLVREFLENLMKENES